MRQGTVNSGPLIALTPRKNFEPLAIIHPDAGNRDDFLNFSNPWQIPGIQIELLNSFRQRFA